MIFSAVLFALAAQQGGPLLQSVLPKSPAPDQVIVRVNGEPILASEIEPYLWDWRGSEVAQDMITYHLILREAKRAGVIVSVPEIQRAFDARLQTMRSTAAPGQNFEDALRAQGFPKSRLYLRVHADLLVDALVLKNFKPTGYVRVLTLAYQPASDAAADVAAAIARAQSAYERVTNGGDWSAEVAKSDDDPRMKLNNGRMGWRVVSAFPQSTQAELKTAKPGLITKPAQAGGAIQVFRVDLFGEAARGEALDELRNAYLAQERPGLMQKLRSEAKIEQVYDPNNPSPVTSTTVATPAKRLTTTRKTLKRRRRLRRHPLHYRGRRWKVVYPARRLPRP